eukprot:scaffold2357_cov167-Amphora_coffeaeformis.AAC.30
MEPGAKTRERTSFLFSCFGWAGGGCAAFLAGAARKHGDVVEAIIPIVNHGWQPLQRIHSPLCFP